MVFLIVNILVEEVGKLTPCLADCCQEVELAIIFIDPELVRPDDIFSVDGHSLRELLRSECEELIEEVLIRHRVLHHEKILKVIVGNLKLSG